jgi:hypothetical protein
MKIKMKFQNEYLQVEKKEIKELIKWGIDKQNGEEF